MLSARNKKLIAIWRQYQPHQENRLYVYLNLILMHRRGKTIAFVLRHVSRSENSIRVLLFLAKTRRCFTDAVHVTVTQCTCPVSKFSALPIRCHCFLFQTDTWVLPHRIKRSCLIVYRTITRLYELKKFPLKKSIRQQTGSFVSVTFFVCVVYSLQTP